MKPKEP